MGTDQEVTFAGAGGVRLSGVLDRPDGETGAVALFAHCFTGGKDFATSRRIADALAERGTAVLRFDFTGLGESGGDFADSTFTSNIVDLVRAADYLRDTIGAPSLLVGHSLGGAAVIAAAERIPEARAVATIGAPADPAHVMGMLAEYREEIEAAGEAEVHLAGRTFRVGKEFLEDVAGQPQTERLARMESALLVLHAPGDDVVGVEHAARIFTAARHSKSYLSLDDADHLLRRRADAEYAAAMIATWAQRYVPSEGAARCESWMG
ncbi:alpha/beta hydrolase family protein [Ruania zhangjianzhongii]|uniref:alpha/beta hydrolase family protein n=1 Tax=Ruania zhangjianzhongii TaxID=2603206 RepID=UPI0011C946FA|nr:alpha/beta hydrolase [Ruania zhangjianzhongii]